MASLGLAVSPAFYAGKLQALSRHKFALAFESAVAPGYRTEKLWQPLWAGALPVVLGDPLLLRRAGTGIPKAAWVDAAEFATAEGLAEHLRHLAANDTAYEEYFEWRREGGPGLPGLAAMQEATVGVHPHCRLCREARDLIEAEVAAWWS